MLTVAFCMSGIFAAWSQMAISYQQAKEIMGDHFLGVTEMKKTFSHVPQFDTLSMSIPITKEALIRAHKNGFALVLRIDTFSGGVPVCYSGIFRMLRDTTKYSPSTKGGGFRKLSFEDNIRSKRCESYVTSFDTIQYGWYLIFIDPDAILKQKNISDFQTKEIVGRDHIRSLLQDEKYVPSIESFSEHYYDVLLSSRGRGNLLPNITKTIIWSWHKGPSVCDNYFLYPSFIEGIDSNRVFESKSEEEKKQNSVLFWQVFLPGQ